MWNRFYSSRLEFAVAPFLSCDLFLLVFPSVLPQPHPCPLLCIFSGLEKPREVIYCPVQTGLCLITSHLEVIFPLVVLELLHNPTGKGTAELGRDEGCAGNSCLEQPLEPPEDQSGDCGKREGKRAGLGLIISLP